MDQLFNQFGNIMKSSAYPIIAQKCSDLETENTRLKERVKYLEDLVKEYTLKMTVNLSGGKVDDFLKAQLQDYGPNDLKNINI